MYLRITLFIICTLLSSISFIYYFSIVTLTIEGINRGIGSYFIPFILVVISSIAWYFYFKIAILWIRYNSVELKLKIIGTIFGLLAILPLTFKYLFIFALPAVFLMLYITIFVPYGDVKTQ